MGWNAHVHREYPGNVESRNLSRDDCSREIVRIICHHVIFDMLLIRFYALTERAPFENAFALVAKAIADLFVSHRPRNGDPKRGNRSNKNCSVTFRSLKSGLLSDPPLEDVDLCFGADIIVFTRCSISTLK